jgi:hypothetical protein
VDLGQVRAAADAFDEANLASQGVQGAGAAADAAGALGHLAVDVAGGKHGAVAIKDVGFVEPALDALLAVGQWLAYLSFHAKSLCARTGIMAGTTMKPRKKPGNFDFFRILARLKAETSLV